jgi:hypothetical protein
VTAVPRTEAPELRSLISIENKRGGRLQVRVNTRKPEEGPLMVSGYDSRRRSTLMVGDEEFLCRMMRSWSQFAENQTPDAQQLAG